MLYKTGIYVRADKTELIEALSSGIEDLGYNVEPVSIGSLTPLPDKGTTLSIVPWTDKWVLLHFDDDKDWMGELLEGVKDGPLYTDIIHCYYRPDQGEYSYTCFRSGDLVETFSSGGPGLGTVVFKSELRIIPLGSIIDAEKFMTESLIMLGLETPPVQQDKEETVWIRVSPPEKGSFFRMLVGGPKK